MGSFQGGGACRGRAIQWQVCERGGQLSSGAGAQDLPGALVEFLGRDPARLEGIGQLG
jgi:hypothetical protein